ncbi:MAG: hypothetical protein KY449_06495 [Proteobacteria bacterium]|nr:hypothetical protein [Pseudomonadota bacterium]
MSRFRAKVWTSLGAAALLGVAACEGGAETEETPAASTAPAAEGEGEDGATTSQPAAPAAEGEGEG